MGVLGYLYAKIIKKLRWNATINSIVDKTAKIESGSSVVNSKIGRFSFCGYDCTVINCNIGSFCSIASRVSMGGTSHPLTWVSTSPAFYKGRDSISKRLASLEYLESEPKKYTEIGHDVWIGEGALIKAGVKIANGAVVGMGAVVTKDVGAYEIWGGTPAHYIKKRFSDEIALSLEKSEWWNYSEEELLIYAVDFNNPEKFLNKVRRA